MSGFALPLIKVQFSLIFLNFSSKKMKVSPNMKLKFSEFVQQINRNRSVFKEARTHTHTNETTFKKRRHLLRTGDKWSPQKSRPGGLQNPRDPDHQQGQPAHHHQAVPPHRQAPPHARQHAPALRQGQQRRQGAQLQPQHAPEVREVLGGAPDVQRVP